MAKKVSKFFRIGVEGDTCDGRVISAQDIQEMAETFDPRVYGCRINLEHLRGILPDGILKRYGDVVELKAEKIDDDSALKGKWALFAKITPTDDLIAMNKAAQKVYTSMEIQPNFANTGKCYLVGLAVTDDPASLGTEYLEFCRTAKHNPLNRFKLSPENLISVATPVELEFEDLPETVFTALTEKVKSIFGRKQASDDARLNDVHEAVTAVAEHVQEKLSATEQRLAEMETAFSALKQDVTDRADETSQAFTRLKNSLDHTESLTQQRRSKATGGALTLESEPLVKLLEENAYRELIWRQRVNEAARAVMLACAAGNDLDVIGANYNTTRLTITPADDSTIPPTPAVMESDTDYRLRIQQAFEGLSVAGSVGAYQYHGRSADGRVADISVTSPSPACVTISVLSRENNGVASEDLLAVVRNAINGEDVRPVADRVTVQSAAIVEYQISK